MSQNTGEIAPAVLAYDATDPHLRHEWTGTSTDTMAETFALEPPMHLWDISPARTNNVFNVPFYSQFRDISSPPWQKVGCGITSLAMVIAHYQPDTVSVDHLLARGIARGAYIEGVGWTYQGLIEVANERGFRGKGYDLKMLETGLAFERFKEALQDGPVITSVHYTFDPQNTISHLVVVSGIEDDTLHYNDPAEKSGNGTISTSDFIRAWKKRYIVVRPAFFVDI